MPQFVFTKSLHYTCLNVVCLNVIHTNIVSHQYYVLNIV